MKSLKNILFVLVFLATECKEQSLTDWMQGHYKKVTGTKVSDVAILRLMFETDGVTYNLGLVMDKLEGEDIAGNKPEAGLPSWLQSLLAIAGLLVLIIILWPILPYIIKMIVAIITLPFKAIAALYRAIKNRGKDSSEAEKPKNTKK